jgi:hypothetical protein
MTWRMKKKKKKERQKNAPRRTAGNLSATKKNIAVQKETSACSFFTRPHPKTKTLT